MEMTKNRISVIKKAVSPDKLSIFRGIDNRVFEFDEQSITYYVPFKSFFKANNNCYKSFNKVYFFSQKSRERVLRARNIKKPAHDIGCNIHIINCGHGDSILVENHGEYALIDFGGRDSYKNVSENYFGVDKSQDSSILKYCKENVKGGKIKAALITHLHEDHIFDIDKITENFEIEKLFMLKKFHGEKFKRTNNFKLLDKAKANEIHFVDIEQIKKREDNSFKIGFANFEIIGPTQDLEDLNLNSLVLLMTYNNMKFLFAGDMTEKAEKNVINHCKLNGIDLKEVNFLKVAHHGSDTSSSKNFLASLGDNLTSVISCGAEDKCKRTQELRQKGILYKTSDNGNVNIKLLPKVRGYVVNAQKQTLSTMQPSLKKPDELNKLGCLNKDLKVFMEEAHPEIYGNDHFDGFYV